MAGFFQNVLVFVQNVYIRAAAVDILNFLQISQEITVTKTPETVRVKSNFKHTVNYLKKLGVPANNSIQVIISNRLNQTNQELVDLKPLT